MKTSVKGHVAQLPILLPCLPPPRSPQLAGNGPSETQSSEVEPYIQGRPACTHLPEARRDFILNRVIFHFRSKAILVAQVLH